MATWPECRSNQRRLIGNERHRSSCERRLHPDSLRQSLRGNTIRPRVGRRRKPSGYPCEMGTLASPGIGHEGSSVSEMAVELKDLDKQNGVTLGRILGRGTVGQAEEGSDGVMRATVRIPEDELVWEPGILVMPHAGVLELEIINDDRNSHLSLIHI